MKPGPTQPGPTKPAAAKRGRLFVASAPSGAGKTSLVKALLASEPQLHLSISHTTRTRRPTEQEGRENHFVSVPPFAHIAPPARLLPHPRAFHNPTPPS